MKESVYVNVRKRDYVSVHHSDLSTNPTLFSVSFLIHFLYSLILLCLNLCSSSHPIILYSLRIYFEALRLVCRAQRKLRWVVVDSWRNYAAVMMGKPFHVSQ